MDKLEAMQRFLLVAQTGSFTRAAERLGLPKSSVSSAVKFLERHLGTRLLHRSTRNVTLTQDGESYLSRCRAILDEVDALESRFQHQNRDIRGTLRIDMPGRFLSNVVLPHLHEWLAAYPNTRFMLSSADHLVDPVKEGIDCVVRVGELADSSLIARPLTSFRIVNCASPAYVERHGVPERLADLVHHRLVGYAPKMESAPATFEYVERGRIRQLEMPSAVAVGSTEAYLSACLAGLGIAQIPWMGLVGHVQRGELVTLLHACEAEPMPVSLLYPSRRHFPKRLSLFIDWLDALVKRLETALP